eukprot:3297220-Rhodomonas_salina.1
MPNARDTIGNLTCVDGALSFTPASTTTDVSPRHGTCGLFRSWGARTREVEREHALVLSAAQAKETRAPPWTSAPRSVGSRHNRAVTASWHARAHVSAGRAIADGDGRGRDCGWEGSG